MSSKNDSFLNMKILDLPLHCIGKLIFPSHKKHFDNCQKSRLRSELELGADTGFFQGTGVKSVLGEYMYIKWFGF